jgi:hypothetical protein
VPPVARPNSVETNHDATVTPSARRGRQGRHAVRRTRPRPSPASGGRPPSPQDEIPQGNARGSQPRGNPYYSTTANAVDAVERCARVVPVWSRAGLVGRGRAMTLPRADRAPPGASANGTPRTAVGASASSKSAMRASGASGGYALGATTTSLTASPREVCSACVDGLRCSGRQGGRAGVARSIRAPLSVCVLTGLWATPASCLTAYRRIHRTPKRGFRRNARGALLRRSGS